MKKLQKLGLKKNFKTNICVIGVGYVGLPLVINLAKSYKVTAYDKNYSRIKELQNGYDRNLDLDKRKIINKEIQFTNNYNDLVKSKVFIITLPTPLNKQKKPDISLVVNATKDLAKILKKGDLIIFESTFTQAQ